MHEGAMENWGLITFREAAVLVADTAGVIDRMRVAVTVAHEMAHLCVWNPNRNRNPNPTPNRKP